MIAILFDTETTGLTLHPDASPEKQPRIIEFAGLLVDTVSGDAIDSISMLVYPEMDVTDEITKITGITNEMLRDQVTWKGAVPKIAEMFAKADMVIAHNLPFDKAMIFNDCARTGGDAAQFWPREEICTVELYRPLFGFAPKLTVLFEQVTGEKLEQTHRALDDVIALWRCVKADICSSAS